MYLDGHKYTWMVIGVSGWSLMYLDGHWCIWMGIGVLKWLQACWPLVMVRLLGETTKGAPAHQETAVHSCHQETPALLSPRNACTPVTNKRLCTPATNKRLCTLVTKKRLCTPATKTCSMWCWGREEGRTIENVAPSVLLLRLVTHTHTHTHTLSDR